LDFAIADARFRIESSRVKSNRDQLRARRKLGRGAGRDFSWRAATWLENWSVPNVETSATGSIGALLSPIEDSRECQTYSLIAFISAAIARGNVAPFLMRVCMMGLVTRHTKLIEQNGLPFVCR
jgi:hypothetical protein